VWAAILFLGKINLVTYRDNTNAEIYLQILQEHLLSAANMVYGGKDAWILQQDNVPFHRARLVSNWLQSQQISVLPWPAKSPDLNPIENVWTLLKLRVRKRLPKTLDELEDIIHEEWDALDLKSIQNLCTSIYTRVSECIQSFGDQINY
jgi:hypothetical protein